MTLFKEIKTGYDCEVNDYEELIIGNNISDYNLPRSYEEININD